MHPSGCRRARCAPSSHRHSPEHRFPCERRSSSILELTNRLVFWIGRLPNTLIFNRSLIATIDRRNSTSKPGLLRSFTYQFGTQLCRFSISQAHIKPSSFQIHKNLDCREPANEPQFLTAEKRSFRNTRRRKHAPCCTPTPAGRKAERYGAGE